MGLVFVFFALFAVFSIDPALAQCGASASSCKNCHEVNAKHPVNDSGDWHTQHAFGDFCSFCHGGDVQATDKEVAHKDMTYPLADPKQSCQTCHPNDTLDRAKVYAVALGVDLKSGDSGNAVGGTGDSGPKVDPAKIELKPIDSPGESNASGALVDYNRRYDVEVLGILDGSRTGNLVLAVSAFALALLGGGLAWRFEHIGAALRKAAAVPEWKQVGETGVYTNTSIIPKSSTPTIPTKSLAVTLPAEARQLDPSTQDALQKLLADPHHGEAILKALSHLDPTLIDSLQSLDKQDRALLLAIVEKLGELKS
jgi:hypothetical protein